MNIGIKKEAIRQALLFLAGLLALSLTSSCERRPLEEMYMESALIPVKIDWSYSGISVTDPAGSGNVHRVSLRFFPKDGSAPFDRYMELNVVEGSIEVPVGEYSVIVFNESYLDTYWTDAITFSEPNSYTNFAATILPDRAENHDYYNPLTGETLIVEPLALASWNLDDFQVTRDMVRYTRYSNTGSTSADQLEEMTKALTKIVMRRLTKNVIVTATVENLVSAQLMQGAMRGFARKVFLASAETAHLPATHVFRFNNRQWDDERQVSGTVSKNFLSFGRLPSSSEYWVNADVLYTTGILHPDPLLFNVTGQVASQTNEDVSINIHIEITLPFVKGGISVGEWDDETITIQ